MHLLPQRVNALLCLKYSENLKYSYRPMKSSLSKRKGAKAFAKLISSSTTGQVLGAHFVGPEAAEIIQVRYMKPLYRVCVNISALSHWTQERLFRY